MPPSTTVSTEPSGTSRWAMLMAFVITVSGPTAPRRGTSHSVVVPPETKIVLPRAHQRGRGLRDAPLLGRVLAEALHRDGLEGRAIVGLAVDQHRPAVHPAQRARRGQVVEVAADRRGAHAEGLGHAGHARGVLRLQQPQDPRWRSTVSISTPAPG